MSNADSVFSDPISEIYQTHLVPMIFEPYAVDIAGRLVSRHRSLDLSNVLEIAAGTGVVTRALASTLPESVTIVATDLNDAMLAQAAKLGTARPVEWRRADVMQLPFGDSTFDAVICQFGVMFFPDKAKAFAEARRVLKAGGVFMFSVWDRIEENEFADSVTNAMATLFPHDPPLLMVRTPHGYHDRATIERDLVNGGFTNRAEFVTRAERSRAASSRAAAIAYCQGTPLRNEINARDASRFDEATDVAAEALAQRFGRAAIDGKIQAHTITVNAGAEWQ